MNQAEVRSRNAGALSGGLLVLCAAAVAAGWAWLLLGFAASSITTGEFHKPRGMFVDEHAIGDGGPSLIIGQGLGNQSCGSVEHTLLDFMAAAAGRTNRRVPSSRGVAPHHSFIRLGPPEQQSTKESTVIVVPLSLDKPELHVVSFLNELFCMLGQRRLVRSTLLLVTDAEHRCDFDKLLSYIFASTQTTGGSTVAGEREAEYGGLGLWREAFVVDLVGASYSSSLPSPSPSPSPLTCRAGRDRDSEHQSRRKANELSGAITGSGWTAAGLAVDPVGSDGALPNMDALAAFRHAYKSQFAVSGPESMSHNGAEYIDTISAFLASIAPSVLSKSSLAALLRRTRNLLHFAASMIVPPPSFHGPLLARNIEAFTIRALSVPHLGRDQSLSAKDIAETVTRFVWSLQPLHGEREDQTIGVSILLINRVFNVSAEELHHSMSLYMLMGSEYFVSFNEYCTWMLVAGFPLLAIGIWLASRLVSTNSALAHIRVTATILCVHIGNDIVLPLLMVACLLLMPRGVRLVCWTALSALPIFSRCILHGWRLKSDAAQIFHERILLIRVVVLIVILVYLIVLNAGAALVGISIAPGCAFLASQPVMQSRYVHRADSVEGSKDAPTTNGSGRRESRHRIFEMLRVSMGIAAAPVSLLFLICFCACGAAPSPSSISSSLSSYAASWGGDSCLLLTAESAVDNAMAQSSTWLVIMALHIASSSILFVPPLHQT